METTQIAIFASGNGGNFAAIVQACIAKKINAAAALLVCDQPNAYVIERAKNFNVPCFVFEPKNYANKAAYETDILAVLRQYNVYLVCLAGYMRIVGGVLLKAYTGRILNIHPALLPAFKGAHAIEDAFGFGVKVFGVTVHIIDETIDGGTILAQRAFEYYGNDIVEVETKIHAIEHQLYPEAINMVLNETLCVEP
jgi:phosphoribosylglycinamide formyltransferase-1